MTSSVWLDLYTKSSPFQEKVGSKNVPNSHKIFYTEIYTVPYLLNNSYLKPIS